MGTHEWILTIGVIVVPLAIAVIVTLWSLEQARYRPKRKRSPGVRHDGADHEPQAASTAGEPIGASDPAKPAT